MNYKSQLTKRIIKKLEKNGVKIIGTPDQMYQIIKAFSD